MTEIQFFFNLDMGKDVVVNTEEKDCIVFFTKDKDNEFDYVGVLQENYNVRYFGFYKEDLQKIVSEKEEFLENATVEEVFMVPAKTLWDKIKIFFLRWR